MCGSVGQNVSAPSVPGTILITVSSNGEELMFVDSLRQQVLAVVDLVDSPVDCAFALAATSTTIVIASVNNCNIVSVVILSLNGRIDFGSDPRHPRLSPASLSGAVRARETIPVFQTGMIWYGLTPYWSKTCGPARFHVHGVEEMEGNTVIHLSWIEGTCMSMHYMVSKRGHSFTNLASLKIDPIFAPGTACLLHDGGLLLTQPKLFRKLAIVSPQDKPGNLVHLDQDSKDLDKYMPADPMRPVWVLDCNMGTRNIDEQVCGVGVVAQQGIVVFDITITMDHQCLGELLLYQTQDQAHMGSMSLLRVAWICSVCRSNTLLA